MTQDQAREKLQPMNLREVERQSGINSQALYRFKGGQQLSPDNFDKLIIWLERFEK